VIDELPPVVQLIVRQPPTLTQLGDLEEFRKYVKRLLPEFRRQALWTIENFNYPQDGKNRDIRGFVIRPSTGLDPFSTFGKCTDLSCRVLNAQHIARSIGLYGDTVLVADRFTTTILDIDRWTAAALYWFAGNILALLTLLPLFEAGVFRFYQSAIAYCDFHYQQFLTQLDNATDAVLDDMGSRIKYRIENDMLCAETGVIHERSLILNARLTKRSRTKLQKGVPVETLGREMIRPQLCDEIFESFLDLQNASRFKAVTFSNSRISLLTAMHVERAAPSRDNIEAWEASRSATLPWVKTLSVSQIVQLRAEAATALPRLRTALASTMTSPNSDERETRLLVKRLEEEAEEVSSELSALNFPQQERDRTGLGLLGLTISIYGMVGEVPLQAMAFGGLIALLGLLHTTRRGDHKEHAKLISRPGYVLLKAKELAEHAEQPLN